MVTLPPLPPDEDDLYAFAFGVGFLIGALLAALAVRLFLP